MADRREVLKGAVGIAATAALIGPALAEPLVEAAAPAPPLAPPIASPSIVGSPITGISRRSYVRNTIDSYFKDVGVFSPQVEALRHWMVKANNRLIDEHPNLFDLDLFAHPSEIALAHRQTCSLTSVRWQFDSPAPGKSVWQLVDKSVDAWVEKAAIELHDLRDRCTLIASDHPAVHQPFRWLIPLVTSGVHLSPNTFEPEARFATRYALKIGGIA